MKGVDKRESLSISFSFKKKRNGQNYYKWPRTS